MSESQSLTAPDLTGANVNEDESISHPVSGETSSPIASGPPTKRRMFQIRWKILLILVFAIFCAMGLGGYGLLKAEPSYWKQRRAFLESHTPEQLMKMAEALERRLLAGLTGVSTSADSGDRVDGSSGGGARTVRISTDEVNAWLDQRLGGWLSNQGKKLPKQMREPMIAVADDSLIFAFRYVGQNLDQIVSGIFSIEIQPDRQASVRLRGIRGGNLPLPAGTITHSLAGGDDDSQASQAAKMLEALDGQSFDPVITVDAQKIRILEIHLRPQQINLTVAADD